MAEVNLNAKQMYEKAHLMLLNPNNDRSTLQDLIRTNVGEGYRLVESMSSIDVSGDEITISVTFRKGM